jgi:3',5'-cyclic AMP phosphodiesterase CpdA
VDTEARLGAALERLRRLDPVPQALVFTGDLADKAEPKAYLRLREIVESAAEELGAQVVWVMGNHDERAAYSRHLFDVESEDPQDRVHDVAGLRVVSLDSTVPGWHHGELRRSQLDWLADVLANPAEHGTVLAMHHPPIPVPMMRIAEIIELRDQQPLAEVVTGSDVRAIIGGHFHFTSYSTFAGIPVSVASATCYTSELSPNQRLLSAVDAHQSFTMVHVYADRVVHSVVPISDAAEISGYGMDMAEPFAALSAEERFEIVSRKDSPLYIGE